VLILAEFIVPGLICGILGACMVGASVVLACMHFPGLAFFIIVIELAGVACSVIAGMFLLSRTQFGKKLVLESSQQAEHGWVAVESDDSLRDATGVVATALRPAGTVIINSKRVDAVSDGAFIDKGASIRVVEVHGGRIVVEAVRD
jgi:membrane-bound serine protease (ClpP class)